MADADHGSFFCKAAAFLQGSRLHLAFLLQLLLEVQSLTCCLRVQGEKQLHLQLGLKLTAELRLGVDGLQTAG